MKVGILIAIAIAVFVAFSCSNEEGGFISRLLKGGESGVPVTVESVGTRDKAQKFTVPGVVENTESAEVSVPQEAIVERFAVSEGDRVEAGDAVAKLSEDELNFRIANLRAELREAQSKLEKDSYLLRNRDRLLEEERIDQEQYDKLENDVQTDESGIEKLGQDVTRLENALGDTALKSPISGIVTKRSASTGTVVPAGTPILTISRVDPSIVTFSLSTDKSSLMRPGKKVKVTFPALSGRRAEGTVTAVDTAIDPEAGTFDVRASVPNPDGIFKSGMRAEIEIEDPVTQQVFVVPEVAIIKEGRSFFVFTVEGGAAHKVQVLPNQTQGKFVEITRGLSEDDLVIVSGNDKIKEGTKVDIWR
jgi:membrane fusion protein (multidrug efflux system)